MCGVTFRLAYCFIKYRKIPPRRSLTVIVWEYISHGRSKDLFCSEYAYKNNIIYVSIIFSLNFNKLLLFFWI